MSKKLLYLVATALFVSCNSEQKPVEHSFTVTGQIAGAQGKYLKIIDMTKAGFVPDSIRIDENGQFAFSQKSEDPKDFVLYILPEDNIRLLPCPDENVTVTAKYPNIATTCAVHGSPESERLMALLRQHNRANQILDSLNHYYMSHQLDKNFGKIVESVRHESDSVFLADRQLHVRFVKEQPWSLASYVALSSKLGLRTSVFDIQNDFDYFMMVDTALMNHYDTITIAKMLDRYVKQAQTRSLLSKGNSGIKIGDVLPDIALPNPYGDTIRISGLGAKYTLVNFWGSWCRPCREANPELRRIFRTYRNKGFTIYSVALERNIDDWKNTIREDRLIWVNHVSELNYMDSKVAKQLGIESIPFSVLIDADRVVLAKNLTTAELEVKLAELTSAK